ncbi:MAG: hypothetical protein VXW65_07190 [Pseudomonadota bacterium]|nr:hypothetical protein [Pseudomonadota bacterium]
MGMLKHLSHWNSMLMTGKVSVGRIRTVGGGNLAQGMDFARALRETAFHQGSDLARVTGLHLLERPFMTRGEMFRYHNDMLENTLVNTAVDFRVTSIVGGDLATGNVVRIKVKAEYADNQKAVDVVQGLNDALHELFNKIVWPITRYGITKGDAYMRPIGQKRVGLRGLDIDIPPECVLPFEKGGETVGFLVSRNGPMLDNWMQVDDAIPLDSRQMVRLKMPRMVGRFLTSYVLDHLAIDDYDQLPLRVGEPGGSLLEGSEQAYRDFVAMMSSLTNQTLLDAIDESFFGLNTSDMNDAQRKKFMENTNKILSASAEEARKVVASGKPFFGKIINLMPIYQEKQLISLQADLGMTGRKQNLSPEHMLMYAKILTASMGVDLTELGFAMDRSASFGDSGAQQTNINAAEDIRRSRVAGADAFMRLIDLHVYYKTGKWPTEDQRVWDVEYAGTSAALAQKEQDLRMTAMQEASMVVSTLSQMKDIGLTRDEGLIVLSKIGRLDDESAKKLCDLFDRSARDAGDADLDLE